MKKPSIKDRVVGALAGASVGGESMVEAREVMESAGLELQELRESAMIQAREGLGLGDLELSLDDYGWRELAGPMRTWNFTRYGLRKMSTLARLMFLINPLIKRAVTVQELYVWGGGCEIKSENEDIQEVMDDFFLHTKNQTVIGASWAEREREQRIDGNTFLMLFRNKYTGSARVRVLQFDQVEDIICNPEDMKEPWFYKRSQMAVDNLSLDQTIEKIQPVFYPDIDYNPTVKVPEIWGVPVNWDIKILHVKTGGLSQMKFGIPEMYSALSWATGYKRILENFATIIQAYARVAMKMTGLSGAKGVAAAKSKMNTSIQQGQARESNPPTNTASWMSLSGNVDISPVKTAGSTTGPDEARALRSMVAAGTDTPEHFFGDSDIGNLATSSTLDRPTELKMIARQNMWRDVIIHIADKLKEWSAVAPFGKLRKAGFKISVKSDIFDGSQTVSLTPPKGKTTHVTANFPQILERNVTDRVRAVVAAATLGGSPAEGIIPNRKILCKLLIEALGEKDALHIVGQMYPDDVMQGFIDPTAKLKNDTLTAEGRKELGDAALIAAKANMKKANNPPEPKEPANV